MKPAEQAADIRGQKSESGNPVVTVLMPVYNAERYIAQAVRSILGQSLQNFELLIIDDGSTDKTRDILNGFNDARIKVIHRERRGVAAALRLGVEMASGQYIARMDADDESMPQRLQVEKDCLDKYSRVAVVHGWVDYIDSESRVIRHKLGNPQSNIATKWLLVWQNVPFHPTVMVRSSMLRDNDINYRLETNRAEDFDLWNRVALVGDFYFVPEVLLHYRVHGKSVTRSEAVELQLEAYEKVIRENFRRYGVNISWEVARELAIISGGAKTDPVSYQYKVLNRTLITLVRNMTGAFTNRLSISASGIAKTQAMQLTRWARYMLNTSRVYSLRLLWESLQRNLAMMFSALFWAVLAGAILPKRIRRWVESSKRLPACV